MKFLILIMISLFSLMCNAQKQSWAPIGSTWYYPVVEYPGSPPRGNIKIEAILDTIILSKQAKKLKETSFSSNGIITTNYFYMYGDSGKVYYWAKNKFHLLYNFNSNKGDNYLVRKPFEFYGLDFSTDSTFNVIVDSISFRYLNNDTLKILHTNWNLTSPWSFGTSKTIEKIGCESFIFPQFNIAIKDSDIIKGLRCYSDNKISIINSSPCFEIVSSIFPQKENQLVSNEPHFSPNPVSSILKITACSNEKIQITDLSGKIIEEFLMDGNTYSLNVSIYKPGMYICKGINFTQKFVVE